MNVTPSVKYWLTALGEEMQRWQETANQSAGNPSFSRASFEREAQLAIFSARRLVEAVNDLPATDQPESWQQLTTTPTSPSPFPPSSSDQHQEKFRLIYTTAQGDVTQVMSGEGIEALAATLTQHNGVFNIRVWSADGRKVTDQFAGWGALCCPLCSNRTAIRYLCSEAENQARYCCDHPTHSQPEFFTAACLWRRSLPMRISDEDEDANNEHFCESPSCADRPGCAAYRYDSHAHGYWGDGEEDAERYAWAREDEQRAP
ncbi:hypothetical protein OG339_47830 (plasmid) [Streptosporangium sp. NBC_01495]|uniref:hypothetical protein n=1 Tax=Streptosporangium sp. NBC_01495 TaxID=2903899 RepID=UPI002E2FD352|nr:hypothetical protein [Streptosporangium sp. NBC_01495]